MKKICHRVVQAEVDQASPRQDSDVEASVEAHMKTSKARAKAKVEAISLFNKEERARKEALDRLENNVNLVEKRIREVNALILSDEGVTKEEAEEALKLLGLTLDGLADNLRTGPGIAVTESWRPLADHVAGLIALAIKRKKAMG